MTIKCKMCLGWYWHFSLSLSPTLSTLFLHPPPSLSLLHCVSASISNLNCSGTSLRLLCSVYMCLCCQCASFRHRCAICGFICRRFRVSFPHRPGTSRTRGRWVKVVTRGIYIIGPGCCVLLKGILENICCLECLITASFSRISAKMERNSISNLKIAQISN